MCMERRRFSQTMASKWQTAFVVSHKMSWCAFLTAVKNYNKSLEKLQDFSSRPRPNVQDQDFIIQDQDFHFCPWGTSRPRPWSRGLNHCLPVAQPLLYGSDLSRFTLRSACFTVSMFYVFIPFLFIAVHCVIQQSVHSVDFIVFCMPVSAVVSLGMICLYAVIASNQINK